MVAYNYIMVTLIDEDKVFKALADASRRKLLDQLHQKNGRPLGELCEGMGMSRQAVTKHLVLLEEANLLVTKKWGRKKLHYLNPGPIYEIYTRWIGKFERQRIEALYDLKQSLEENDDE
jgi:DNA-binding transcriptional ArsR family regulator